MDILRVLACLMVVMMHSPLPGSAQGSVLTFISLITAPCIGLFFMISGALLLPVTTDTGSFLRHRLGKVLLPTIIWTLFYISVNLLTGKTDFSGLWLAVCSMPFSPQGHGVMWFMYVLVGLYLLAPIVSPWLRAASEKELRLFLLLWGVSLLYPVLSLFIEVAEGPESALYYFSGYAGYFLLGYYMHRFFRRRSPWLMAACIAIPLCSCAAVKLAHCDVDFYSLFWYLSIGVAVMCFAWFQAFSQIFRKTAIPSRIRKMVTNFSNCSFGIYLVHIFVMRNLLWNSALIAKVGGCSRYASYSRLPQQSPGCWCI